MKKYVLYIFLIVLVQACVEKEQRTVEAPTAKSPKNIILMIGDGMGLSQVSAAMTVKKDEMNMTRCDHTGLVKTSSLNKLITDSGAAGTAMATGRKTNNGHISVDTLGNPYKTILEIAEEHGKATGLVASCGITHATPASFIAHNTNRGKYEEIAYDFLHTDFDVIIGGGKNHFAARKDGLNLLDSLREREYQVVENLIDMKGVTGGKLVALVYEAHPPKKLEGRGDFLENASIKALDLLDQHEEGFFLMIEGSQIDWGGHDNDTKYVLTETVDFDNAVGKALDFADKDGETLVIVTADHETGGFSVVAGNNEEGITAGNFGSGGHTATMVPIFAYGPGAEDFTGVYDNTDIFVKMMKAFGFKSE